MKTLKLIALALLMITSVATAQSFTNTVNKKVDDQHIFNFELGNNSNHEVVDKPLAFFMTLSTYSASNPQTISGELKHNGVIYYLFSDFHPTENPTVIAPIDSYFGEKANGNWQFKLYTQTPLTIENWGLIPIAPEPSIIALLGIGGLILMINKKKV
jgi:PEP-CTERM putative exosortase interaction domain